MHASSFRLIRYMWGSSLPLEIGSFTPCLHAVRTKEAASVCIACYSCCFIDPYIDPVVAEPNRYTDVHSIVRFMVAELDFSSTDLQ